MTRVCEDHLTLDLARLDLRPGAMRRLPRVHLSWFEYQRNPRGYGYDNVRLTKWVSAAYASTGDGVRVALSESAPNRTVRRTTHHVTLIESPNVIGGTRQWFACPDCARKARKLYYRRDAFRCQPCARVKHRSTVTFKTQRQSDRVGEIESEFGAAPFEPLGPRPRYMRRKREADLRSEYVRLRVALGWNAVTAVENARGEG